MKTTFQLSLIICALAAFSGALQLKGSDPDLMPMLDDNITISTLKTSGVVSEEGPTFTVKNTGSSSITTTIQDTDLDEPKCSACDSKKCCLTGLCSSSTNPCDGAEIGAILNATANSCLKLATLPDV